MDLSIIIVNYRTRELTLACIASVYASLTSYTYEIILVDNASNDGMIVAATEQFPQVITIANKENVGFSRANNQGIRIAGHLFGGGRCRSLRLPQRHLHHRIHGDDQPGTQRFWSRQLLVIPGLVEGTANGIHRGKR